MKDLSSLLVNRTKELTLDLMDTLFSTISDPSILSLASGAVDINTLPKEEEMVFFTQKALKRHGKNLLQYSTPNGLDFTRELLLVKLKKEKRIPNTFLHENITLSPGALSIIDSIAKAYIEEGTPVMTPDPSYYTSLMSIKAFGAKLCTIESDKEGPIPESIISVANENKARILLLNPNFTNPTGETISEKRRMEIAKIVIDKDILIIEDDPYFELRYKNANISTFISLCPKNTIYIGSFSKILSPGLRVGYFVANTEISHMIRAAQQVTYLHASTLDQAIIGEYLNSTIYQKTINKIASTYKAKAKCMQETLENEMSGIKGVTWNIPDGGMFYWLKAPIGYKTYKQFPNAIKNKIAYVPGNIFFAEYSKNFDSEFLRLNFTKESEENIKIGIKRIASLFKEFQSQK